MNLSVREIGAGDIPHIIFYWLDSDPDYLVGMGVDLDKLPTASDLKSMLESQIGVPISNKKSYALIWELDGRPIGHNNVNQITIGEKAHMHLHIWKKEDRKMGLGIALLHLSIPIFFQKLNLKELYCEPYSLNPAPNRTLEKLGFEFIKDYKTIPGSLNFEQIVSLWRLSRESLIDEKGNAFGFS